MGKVLDSNLNKYENFILLGDFNATGSDKALAEFNNTFNLKNLINEPTCYQTFITLRLLTLF